MFTDTNPKIGDSDNNLLFKIAQALHGGLTADPNILLSPAVGASDTPFGFNTTLTHTSGYLFIIANNGTPKFSVASDGGIIGGAGATFSGVVQASGFRVGATPGVSGTITGASTVTVVNGIITAIA